MIKYNREWVARQGWERVATRDAGCPVFHSILVSTANH